MAQPTSPHVASPAKLLEHEVATRRRAMRDTVFAVACDGAAHAVRFDGARLSADDHDAETEAVVHALGGAVPACMRAVDAASAAGPAELWSALVAVESSASTSLEADGDDALRVLPAELLRLLLAMAIADEFADAAIAVRDAAAPLGLALLGEPPRTTSQLRKKFEATRGFPHWDVGPGPWSDEELGVLARYTRRSGGTSRPYLDLVPADPAGRHAVARYLAQLLEGGRTMTAAELKTALSPSHRNTRALTALLVAERFLEHVDGSYRVRSGGRAPSRRRTGGRS